MSPSSRKIRIMPLIVCVGGPTGAGKDTIVTEFLVTELLKDAVEFRRIPRSTTRKPRPHEVAGFHYHFLSPQEFSAREALGKISAVDRFCGAEYGIDVGLIDETLRSGMNVIGVFGVCSFTLRELYGERALLVYVAAPPDLLEKRLRERGDAPQEIVSRLKAAVAQISEEPKKFDCVIENTGTVEDAVSELKEIIAQRKRL